jgi:hypothetical protein
MAMNAIDYGAGATLYILPAKIGGDIAGQSSEYTDMTVAEAIRRLIDLPEANREFSYIALHGSSKQISRNEAIAISQREGFPSDRRGE